MVLSKQKTYLEAFRIACGELLAGNPEERMGNAAVQFEREGPILHAHIPFFNETIVMDLPDLRFRSSAASNVTLVTKIIILHYLLKASGEPLSGRQAAYEDISVLRHYLPAFERRVVKPLCAAFGREPQAFTEAGTAMGGRAEDFGDAAVTLFALPRVPITFILWAADDEFPPSLRALYDDTIASYLPLEDIVVVTKLAGTRLLKAARRLYAEDAW